MKAAAVEIPVEPGTVLRGERHGTGDDWAVLVHDEGRDLDAWRPLLPGLERSGVTALAIDLRGHGGSDGTADRAATASDAAGAIGWARREGARRLYLFGAGGNARPVLEAARKVRSDAALLVGPTCLSTDAIPPLPRLALIARGVDDQVESGRLLTTAPGWAVVVELPGEGQGTRLLEGTWGTNATAHLLTFLRQRRHVPLAAQYGVPVGSG